MNKILHLEDDLATARAVEEDLTEAGYIVEHYGDVDADTHKCVADQSHDVILLDINFHGEPKGLDVLRSMKEASIGVPVIVLSCCCNTEDKVAALRLGACDYITKPYHKDELVARIEAVFRRRDKYYSDVVAFGNLRLNKLARRVTVEGKDIKCISLKMFLLLQALVEANGRQVTHYTLECLMYGDMKYRRSFHVFKSKLIRILKRAGWNKSIVRVSAGKYAVA